MADAWLTRQGDRLVPDATREAVPRARCDREADGALRNMPGGVPYARGRPRDRVNGPQAEVSFTIDLIPDHKGMYVRISDGPQQHTFGLTLSEARALSLALVRLASMVERRSRPPLESGC